MPITPRAQALPAGRLALPGSESGPIDEVGDPFDRHVGGFDPLVEQWVPLTLLLNSLNRSLGQDDTYPFALASATLDKLRFVHDAIRSPRGEASAETAASPGAVTIQPSSGSSCGGKP